MNDSAYSPSDSSRPLSIGEWMITLIILAIPIANFVFYLYWAFGGSVNVNRRNFCRASVYLFLIVVALYIGVVGLSVLVAGLFR